MSMEDEKGTQTTTENTVSREEYDSLMNKFNDLLQVATNLTKQVEHIDTTGGNQPTPHPKEKEPKISGDEAFLEWCKKF